MALIIIGTIPPDTCYPGTLQELAVLLAAVLDKAGSSGGVKILYVQSSQPTGVSEETAWFEPTGQILKIYGRRPGDITASWFDLKLPAGSVVGAMLAAGTITSRELSGDILAQLSAVAAATANSVVGLETWVGGGSHNANFFIMSDGTMRSTGVSKITVSAVDHYKNGTGFVSSADASVLPKRCGFSPPLDGDSITKVYAMQTATFCITAAGAVYATGYNGIGQLGLGDTTDRVVFVKIDQTYFGGDAVAELAIGSGKGSRFSVYARTSTGKIYAWGHNYYGQLGLGGVVVNNTNQPSLPTFVSALGTDNAQVVSAGAGDNVTTDMKVSAYVRKTGGTVYACGYNGDGQLGQGNTTSLSSFTAISALTNISLIRAAGDDGHTAFYAVETNGADGKVWSVGYNNKGQLGNGNTTVQSSMQTPLTLTAQHALDLVPACSGVNFSVYVRIDDGTLRVWGSNADKQLGLGSGAGTTNVTAPATPTIVDLDSNVLFVADVKAGAAGTQISAAVLTRIFSGFDALAPKYHVYCAGSAERGNLGTGVVTDTPDFTRCLIDTELIAALAFGGGNSHASANVTGLLIRLQNGSCLACGYDAASIGQLGVDASPASISVPAYVNF